MKITFLVPVLDLSGGARVIHTYAKLLGTRGHDVTVVVPKRKRVSVKNRLRNLLSTRKHFLRMPKFPTHYSGENYRIIVSESSRQIQVTDLPQSDVIIATWFETAEWMISMPDHIGAKVHFVQGYEAFKPQWKSRVDAVLAAKTSKITISSWLQDILENEFVNDRVFMVPNGVDISQFYAPERTKSDDFVVGMLYHPGGVKNLQFGLEIFRRYRKYNSKAKLVCFGLNPEHSQYPLPEEAILYVNPLQDDLRKIYAMCDVWLCSSDPEGFYLPMFEAMACRCPVVSTPIGGALDHIKDGVNGFLFPLGDTTSAVECLKNISNLDGEQWKIISDNAFETARGMRWEILVNSFERALVYSAEDFKFENVIDVGHAGGGSPVRRY